jgi:hypothetical protein
VIKQQIDHTRTELAETVEALANKVDVSSRGKERIAVKRSQLREKATTARHRMGERAAATRTRAHSGAAGAAIAILMLALYLRRKRSS